jgi:hypothetical protein
MGGRPHRALRLVVDIEFNVTHLTGLLPFNGPEPVLI